MSELERLRGEVDELKRDVADLKARLRSLEKGLGWAMHAPAPSVEPRRGPPLPPQAEHRATDPEI